MRLVKPQRWSSSMTCLSNPLEVIDLEVEEARLRLAAARKAYREARKAYRASQHSIGQKARALRLFSGWVVKDLSARTGLSQVEVRGLEAGIRNWEHFHAKWQAAFLK
jgi:hypothetical protein